MITQNTARMLKKKRTISGEYLRKGIQTPRSMSSCSNALLFDFELLGSCNGLTTAPFPVVEAKFEIRTLRTFLCSILGERVNWGETVYRELTQKDSMESEDEEKWDFVNPNLKKKFGAFWCWKMKMKILRVNKLRSYLKISFRI